MRLRPLQPPGRVTRKARAYEADIEQMRSEGYTLEAIRQALAAEGVEVSVSTVSREGLRRNRRPAVSPAPTPNAHDGAFRGLPQASEDATPAGPSGLDARDRLPASAAASMSMPDPRPAPLSGKDIAEAFRRSQSGNPFIRDHRTDGAKEES